jgi:hypothetical protein
MHQHVSFICGLSYAAGAAAAEILAFDLGDVGLGQYGYGGSVPTTGIASSVGPLMNCPVSSRTRPHTEC